SRRLFTLVVRDGSEVIGIVPTELDAGGDLCFVGDAVADYSGPVYRRARVEDVVRATVALLGAERRVTLLDLQGLREASPFVASLRRDEGREWSEARTIQIATAPYIDLSAGWDAVFARLKHKHRANFVRKWKALERFGALEFSETGEPAEVLDALPEIFALFRRRWAGRRESGGFAGRHRPFHERVAPALAAAGHLRVSTLRLDGRLIAFSYGLAAGDATSSYVLAHDDALGVYSPGGVLVTRLFEAACRRGETEYDMSVGEEDFKNAWATGVRGVFRLLRWRRRSPARLTGELRRLGNQAWVTGRSVPWLRRLKREGVRRFALGPRPFASEPDVPGLAAGDGRTWHVHRIACAPESELDVGVRPWTYGAMTGRLSPRLLALAADRNYRGDVLLAVQSRGHLVGVVWRAEGARRGRVTGGHDVPPEAPVYYHPIATRGRHVLDVVRALSQVAGSAAGFVVVARSRLAGERAQHLRSFRDDARFTDASADGMRPPPTPPQGRGRARRGGVSASVALRVESPSATGDRRAVDASAEAPRPHP